MKLFDVYSLLDLEPVRAEGAYLWDKNGVEYLDFYGGHAVISIGHTHPHYVEKITDQLSRIGFYSNAVINGLQVELAEKLGPLTGYPDYELFLCNSGAEANENAVKLASFTTGRSRILAMHAAFHGRTSMAVALSDNPAIQAPANKTDNVTFIDLNDVEALERELLSEQYAAVIIEPIQGVGGIRMASGEFLHAARELCDRTGTLLVMDEVQSGYGRSGKFFAHQWLDIRPDIITVAKGIANGFPMGGVLISPDFVPEYGQLGTTFGGNHLACAAATAVLDVMENENLVENARIVGEYLIEKLNELKQTEPHIVDVRGRGLMIGIELDIPHKDVRRRLIFNEHCFTGCSGTNILRLLPPLCMTKAMADEFIEKLKKAFKE